MRDPAGAGEEFLSLEILRVGATPEANGHVKLAIATSRGDIPGVLHPHQGGEGAVIWVSGAIGGITGPAGGIYATLSDELAQAGLTSLRLDYRKAGELEECVLDTLAGVSVLSGLGAERIALVGHSFGGAVVITAGTLSLAVTAVVAMSSQTAGATGAGKLTPRPLLLVHGEDDSHLTYRCSEMIYEWAGEPKELKIMRGAGHGLRECADELRPMLRDWLVERLAG